MPLPFTVEMRATKDLFGRTTAACDEAATLVDELSRPQQAPQRPASPGHRKGSNLRAEEGDAMRSDT
jgi:hypothetical protein